MHGTVRGMRGLYAIIYEFGAPKKAAAAVGSKCAPRISNRSARRIKYFMENDLFNGPYGRRGPFVSALICSQGGRRKPYRLPPRAARTLAGPWPRSRYPFAANERANRGILRFSRIF